MKIQCDACNKEFASVFCTADEAALCDACDHCIHHANKLASKHQRFSLLHPKQVHLCDICQEKQAFLFCVQDRAILCKDCDVPIHSANEHTQRHHRFLLTGVKLSATSALYNSSSSSSSSSSIASLSNNGDSVPEFNKFQLLVDDPFCVAKSSSITATAKNSGDHYKNLLATGSMSSISEYLIDTLPGWQVEDFLDSTSHPIGFSKTAAAADDNDEGMLPFLDADIESNMSIHSPEGIGPWVPQQSLSSSLYTPQNASPIGLKETKETIGIKVNWRRNDDAFTVPEIIPPSTASKRFRPLS